jgi:hypothetical protein
MANALEINISAGVLAVAAALASSSTFSRAAHLQS